MTNTKTKKAIDLAQIEDMAGEFATEAEIAADMGFDRTLFHRRKDVREAFLRGKNSAKLSLRHMMFLSAQGGDRTMMIFLAKNELGYRDNPDPLPDDNKVDDTENTLIKAIKSMAKSFAAQGATGDKPFDCPDTDDEAAVSLDESDTETT
ncbi:MAG: hypothetical protein IKR85_06880 [Clostridia bacterium]|nr:hypothetical protein [Clostridia bacterium]